MSVRIKTTTQWHQFFTFASWLGGVFCGAAVTCGVLLKIWPSFGKEHEWVPWVVFFLTVFLWRVITNPVFVTLSSYLHIAISLKTKVKLSEAGKLAWLFVPNETGKWWPLKEIRDVRPELRRTALFQAAESIRASLGKPQAECPSRIGSTA